MVLNKATYIMYVLQLGSGFNLQTSNMVILLVVKCIVNTFL